MQLVYRAQSLDLLGSRISPQAAQGKRAAAFQSECVRNAKRMNSAKVPTLLVHGGQPFARFQEPAHGNAIRKANFDGGLVLLVGGLSSNNVVWCARGLAIGWLENMSSEFYEMRTGRKRCR